MKQIEIIVYTIFFSPKAEWLGLFGIRTLDNF
jgi:hypothetical protein